MAQGHISLSLGHCFLYFGLARHVPIFLGFPVLNLFDTKHDGLVSGRPNPAQFPALLAVVTFLEVSCVAELGNSDSAFIMVRRVSLFDDSAPSALSY